MTPETLRASVRERLMALGCDAAQADAEWRLILCHVADAAAPTRLLLNDLALDADACERIEALLRARETMREPIQYLLKSASFYGLDFEVGPGVLIPRPETELLVEKALAFLNAKKSMSGTPLRVLDIGTGSGCIALAIKQALGEAVEVTAVEISPKALGYAKRNANRLGLTVEFILGDAFKTVMNRQFDLIISNPPYIPDAEKTDMMAEVIAHEPAMALFPSALHPGADALHYYRLLATEAPSRLPQGGCVMAEIAASQALAVLSCFDAMDVWKVTIDADLAGLPRLVVATLTG